jgi:hypothetical protein
VALVNSKHRPEVRVKTSFIVSPVALFLAVFGQGG